METNSDNVRGVPLPKSRWEDPQFLGILVAVIAVFFTLVLLSIYLKKKVKRDGILLLGLSDAGKTLIFVRLAYNKFFDTYTSMKENLTEYTTAGKTVTLIDVPGQERVRNRILDQYKPNTCGMVYVVDSLTVQKQLRDVAEFLYNILCDDILRGLKPPLLILCNKQDQTMAKGSSAIRSLLEKEMNILRKTKTSQLDSIDNKSSSAFLGKQGKDFEFEHLGTQVTFAESSAAITSEDQVSDLEELKKWLQAIV